jgi:urease accessory protein
MEAAVTAGLVRELADLHDFCVGRLETAGVVVAAFAAAACALWQRDGTPEAWRDLDDALSARTPSEAMRSASRATGNGLRRLVVATFPGADLSRPWALVPGPAPHHPLVLGAGCALAGGSSELAARSAALGICTTASSAAVRLLGLDPYAAHSVVSELGPQIDRIAAQADGFVDPAALPALAAPGLELLADVHARSEVRLFAS